MTIDPKTLKKQPAPETLEDALARIAELEAALDESINIILRRDAQILHYEREILKLSDQEEARQKSAT